MCIAPKLSIFNSLKFKPDILDQVASKKILYILPAAALDPLLSPLLNSSCTARSVINNKISKIHWVLRRKGIC
jgi:hypothetical protein